MKTTNKQSNKQTNISDVYAYLNRGQLHAEMGNSKLI